ncbi:MAG: 30S ribosomal protein S3 [Cytophagales bacterium]|nr:MAG: 30S ribosomal protein S3 [Cytophagales bacterium]TAF61007.1 MAG: 30S ribosomal protein S3 [Cytophagales bacterium]
MGQKVNPTGLRLGIIKGWDSNWYGGRGFADKLIEDSKIRQYIRTRIPRGAISKVVIERTLKRITITIHTARPGVVIGKEGAEVEKIRQELNKITSKDVQINIYEVKRPEIDATLVAENVAQQLEARMSHRRAMKQAISNAMRNAQGIKVKLSGRLGGADMSRTEMYKEGRIPLHTLRADIDYAYTFAQTVYGKIGIKVWICKGEIYGKPDLTPEHAVENTGAQKRQGGNNERGDRGERSDRGVRGGRSNDDNRNERGNNNNNNNRGNNNRGGNNRGGGQGGNRGGGGGGRR